MRQLLALWCVAFVLLLVGCGVVVSHHRYRWRSTGWVAGGGTCQQITGWGPRRASPIRVTGLTHVEVVTRLVSDGCGVTNST